MPRFDRPHRGAGGMPNSRTRSSSRANGNEHGLNSATRSGELKHVLGEVILKIHRPMENPANFHAAVPDSVSDVVVLHAIKPAPFQEVITRLASQAHGVFADFFQRLVDVSPVGSELGCSKRPKNGGLRLLQYLRLIYFTDILT